MRQMWELPGPTPMRRITNIAMVVALVWAAIAVPLTIWLVVRDQPLPPPPPTRQLSAMEAAAVRYGAQSLADAPVRVDSTVTTANAKLDVSQVIDLARGVASGNVTSQNYRGDLVVVSGHTLLRGSPQFWASVGVPTSEPGWVDVGDRLGPIAFPLLDAVTKLDPSDEGTYVDSPEAGAEMMTFHNGDVSATFTEAGVARLTVGDNEGAVTPAPGDAGRRLDAAAGTKVPDAKLIGASSALSVSAAPPAPPAPDSENADDNAADSGGE